jgi:chromosomal replication initiator protein
MQQKWEEILEHLRITVLPQTYSTWIAPLSLMKEEEERIVLGAPNQFYVSWIKNHEILPSLSEAAQKAYGKPVYIDFVITGDKDDKPVKEAAPAPEINISTPREDWKGLSVRAGMNPRHTFNSFVVGSCNEFAHAASVAMAGDTPRTYNPLFIYGGTGMGKTHLLNAIGNEKIKSNPDLKVCYVHTDYFISEMVQSLANQRMAQFRQKYRSMDILLMDDIQFLSKKERTQEVFFHTFNDLYERQKSIIVTSDMFPKEIPDLEDRLRSRFEWGLIADIQPPDMETKMAILQKKAELESVVLPGDVCQFMALRITSHIRELEGALTRLIAFASLMRTEINLELAQKVLRDSLSEVGGETSVDDIIKAVALHFRLKINDLKGRRRTKAIAWARQIAMYLSRELTDSSFPEIGQKTGGRDHSTVMYACEKVIKEMENKTDVKQQVETIRSSIMG